VRLAALPRCSDSAAGRWRGWCFGCGYSVLLTLQQAWQLYTDGAPTAVVPLVLHMLLLLLLQLSPSAALVFAD
jgi:hypothetical protein